jgi:acyl phosphate:glycerol-3-phosphate acyltransferase
LINFADVYHQNNLNSTMKIELYIILFAASYLMGSIPTAYILLKLTRKKDIRDMGSGNVGALNALRSSKSKTVAATVLILDVLKGALPCYIFTNYFTTDSLVPLFVCTGVVYGHCFPVWLKFKGGRGLATAAGALIVFEPILVLFWVVLWLLYFVLIKKHIVANLVATFILPLVVFLTTPSMFNIEVLGTVLPVFMLILLRHLERVPDVIIETISK